MQADSTLGFTIVLPVSDEAGHPSTELESIVTAMGTSPYTREIVVVDDHSTDGGRQAPPELERVRLVSLAQSWGSGTAHREGTALARGRWWYGPTPT